ncbi:MAG: cytochrome c [Woeseiaceae bacterium]
MKRYVTAGTFLVLGAVVMPITAAHSADIRAGRSVYETNCAVCHGQDGKPDANSPVVKGLGVTPADFSDPLFNSREPSGDWEMVIKYGGHAMGLAEQMPAQEGALTDTQIENVAAYIKSMVDTSEYPPGEMNLMLPTRVKKAFLEDEVVYKGRFTNQDGENAYKNVVEIEKRIGKRGQAIFELVHNSQAM